MSQRKPLYLAGAACSAAFLLFAVLVPRGLAPWIPCGFLALTGYPCPFCGTTRAVLDAGHGLWGAAVRESPLGSLLVPAAALLLAWCVWRLARRDPAGPPPLPLRFPTWAGYVLALAVLANWFYRLATGLK